MMGQKQQQRLIGTLLLVCFIAILAYIVLSNVSENEVAQRQITTESEPEFSSLVEPVDERSHEQSADSAGFSTDEEAFIDLQAKPAESAPQIVDKLDLPTSAQQQRPVTKEEVVPAVKAEPVEKVVTTPPTAESKTIQPAPEKTPVPETKPAPEKTPVPETKPEPEKPVIVSDSTPAPAVEPASQWILQLGSFSVEANAINLKKQLEDLGYQPLIEQTRSAGTVIYRVRLQPNTDRSALDKTAASIRQQLNLNTQIFPYP